MHKIGQYYQEQSYPHHVYQLVCTETNKLILVNVLGGNRYKEPATVKVDKMTIETSALKALSGDMILKPITITEAAVWMIQNADKVD